MSEAIAATCRFFLTYSGVNLPLKLTTELEPEQLSHRNTYFQGFFDDQDRLVGLQKMVYGEVEMEHRYAYHRNGKLRRAEITDAEGELTVLDFNEDGLRLAGAAMD
ncbi:MULTISPECIES: DUF6156 family protein [Methylococcus]|uniref:DUF6156 family protein n=1 Tax=Methylococcus capsulatus TaxID=414 RepID=A0ABZ2F2W8_METCP|nr:MULTISPECIES: DUF6156 family protein [Methylococcus]MDF9392146.1 hypothetical protein [Methylococcus capsulatus]